MAEISDLEPAYRQGDRKLGETISEEDAIYALRLVKTICTDVGPGLPGTSQERERADVIRKELETHLGAGNVGIEEFALAPNACLGSYLLGGVFIILAAALNISTGIYAGISPLVTAISAMVFSIIPILLFVFEFFFGFELIDPFFRKKQSLNVIGTLRKPMTRSVKRLLILSGHHDSAWENNWLRLPGYGFFAALGTWLAGLIVMTTMAIIQLTGVITSDATLVRLGTLSWPLLAYPIVPSAILSLFFISGRKNGGNVPGAADNLSGCAVVAAMCRFLVRNPENIPPDTEIRFVTFGSEEAGLRGSRRYVKQHLGELKRLDARVLNVEVVASPETNILTSEVNGTVKNSREMVKSVVIAAEKAGVPYKVRRATLGEGSDAGPFSRAGIKATTLLCLKTPQQMLSFYHQRWDLPEVLSIEPLLNVLKISFKWISGGAIEQKTIPITKRTRVDQKKL